MLRAELDRDISLLEKNLLSKNTIPRAIEVAQKFGTKNEDPKPSLGVKYLYEARAMKVEYSTMVGGINHSDDLRVFFDKQLVLHAKRIHLKRYPEFLIEVGYDSISSSGENYEVLTYLPNSSWEDYFDTLAQIVPISVAKEMKFRYGLPNGK